MPSKKSAPGKKLSEKPKGSRSGDTRRPIERIFTIHQAIQRGRFPNCRQLAEQIEVTQKTIQRDITFMQNDLGLPLAYNGAKHGYFYERPVHEFPMMNYTVEDVVALFLARKAVEPLQGSPLEATLRDSFKRLSGALQGEISFRWTDLDEVFSVKDTGVVPGDVRLFEKGDARNDNGPEQLRRNLPLDPKLGTAGRGDGAGGAARGDSKGFRGSPC